MLRSLALILTGVLAGWFLNDALNSGPTMTIESSQVSGQLVTTGKPGIADPPEQPQPVDKQPLPTASAIPTKPLNIDQLIANGSYEEAVAGCMETDDSEWRQCRNALFDAVKHQKLPSTDSRYLLELWMSDNPEDAQAGIMLAQLAVSDKQFQTALQGLANLRSYVTDTGDLHLLAGAMNQLAEQSIDQLYRAGDFEALIGLYSILVQLEPERAGWRYSMASVQHDLKQYQGALDSLTYILFDPVMGANAQALYDQIAQRLNLADYVEVPLTRSGPHFLVTALLNNTHEMKLMLDTGASITSIKKETLGRLGLLSGAGRNIMLNTAGGQVRSTLLKLGNLSVGGQSINDVEVATLSYFDDLSDGLLGMNYLGNFRFVIDQKQERLYLSPR